MTTIPSVTSLATSLGEFPPEAVIFGHSEVMQSLRDRMDKVASANVPVLIQGESGNGKDIIARMIHGLTAAAGRAVLPHRRSGRQESRSARGLRHQPRVGSGNRKRHVPPGPVLSHQRGEPADAAFTRAARRYSRPGRLFPRILQPQVQLPRPHAFGGFDGLAAETSLAG